MIQMDDLPFRHQRGNFGILGCKKSHEKGIPVTQLKGNLQLVM